jgi:hypothetical protein
MNYLRPRFLSLGSCYIKLKDTQMVLIALFSRIYGSGLMNSTEGKDEGEECGT